jgi:CxxC-x17-CxxC domain-containing protein
MQSVPQITMMNDNGVGSENCEYCQDFGFSKNCYLTTGGWELQDCYYCDCNCLKSRHLFDCYSVHFSELVYDSVASQHLYQCSYLTHCDNCNDCSFGIDLKGCRNCIGCIGLRQRQFCIFNEQYSEDDYKQKAASLGLNSYEGLKRFQQQYGEWIRTFPRKSVHMVNCENCIGDDLFNCKNVVGFQQDAAEYCKFIVHGDAPKNSYDVSQTGRPEWCYEGATPDNSYMTHFTTWCWKDKNVMYSDNCHSCEHLFGCIGLKRKQYCILNRQYTKEEYERMVPKIIDRMTRDGEWGEFFPMTMSPYCYNETAAQEYFPREKEQVQALGLQWRDDDPKVYKPQQVIIPDRIEDVPDSMTGDILACENCRRNFKILHQELTFYRTMNLPAPHTCYDCRYRDRVKRRNPRKLWERACAKCGNDIQSSFSPDRLEIVYCEECYLQEVY